ncbi:MAG TPA: flagellar hook-associated protein FlgL [Solirubrobacteraceae bacterium]|jgi:flagellar hook-associated protein 3 FlgL|nr:flagellar hook-associated protein FlgL [Solirubrobacteraceae bacterium]
MSTRITNDMVIGSTLADINSAQLAMARTQSELSSGKSILEPSDNPYGASQAIALQSSIDGLTSYEKSVQDGVSWMNTSSSGLASIDSQVQRVRELVLQGANEINSPTDLANIAAEVAQLAEGVKQDANTQYAGQYVFSGTLTNTPPYQPGAGKDAYQGNAGAVFRAISPASSVNVSVNLASVLGNGAEPGDGKLLDTLRTIAKNLQEGTPAAIEALRTTDLKTLDTNLNNLTGLQAEAGAVTDQLDVAASRIQALHNTAAQQLSNVQDANIAKVSIEFSNEHAAFEAALRAGASIVQESLLEFLH